MNIIVVDGEHVPRCCGKLASLALLDYLCALKVLL